MPDAFAEQGQAGWPGVQADYAHNGEVLLGTTLASTLRLVATSAGLSYEIDLPQALRAHLSELISRGDLTGASIAFTTTGDEWDSTGGPEGIAVRTVRQALLRAVSLVPFPAYPQTTARIPAARSSQTVGGPLATSTRLLSVRETAVTWTP